jgi:hypothetical protein
MLWKAGSRDSTAEGIRTFIGSVTSLYNDIEARGEVAAVAAGPGAFTRAGR